MALALSSVIAGALLPAAAHASGDPAPCTVADELNADTTAPTVPTVSPTDPSARICQAHGAIGHIRAGTTSADHATASQVPAQSGSAPASLPAAVPPARSGAAPTAASIAAIGVPAERIPPTDNFVVGTTVYHSDTQDWIQAGWIAGDHCGTDVPTVFTEVGINGDWTDECWNDYFPLQPGQEYYFALTQTVSETTTWLFWNGSWYSLNTAATPAASSVQVPNCAAGQCVDGPGTTEAATSVGLTLCGILFEVCAPVATVGGLTLGLVDLANSVGGPGSVCHSAPTGVSFSGSTASFSGTSRCNANVYSLLGSLYGVQNGKRYASSGLTCNFCSVINLGLSAATQFYADYQAEVLTTVFYNSSGGPNERWDRFSTYYCPCR